MPRGTGSTQGGLSLQRGLWNPGGSPHPRAGGSGRLEKWGQASLRPLAHQLRLLSLLLLFSKRDRGYGSAPSAPQPPSWEEEQNLEEAVGGQGVLKEGQSLAVGGPPSEALGSLAPL